MSTPAIQQINKLIRGGMTKDQIADSLDMPLEQLEAILLASKGEACLQKLTAEELINNAKPRAVQVLVDMLDAVDNPHLQLKAATVILNNGKELAEVDNEKLDSAIAQMHRIMERYNNPKIIDIPASKKHEQLALEDKEFVAAAI